MVARWFPKIGIVQGRLVPPVQGKIQTFPERNWEREFTLVRKAGFDGIEWLFDGEENPLLSADGRLRIRELIGAYGVEIPSVSADYLMFFPIFGATKAKSVAVLKRLIEACGEAGIRRINIPLEDQSELKKTDDVSDAVDGLRQCLPLAKRCGVVLAAESSLAPANLFAFAKLVNRSNFGINYDLGNSAALGYDTDGALRLLKPFLAGIHVKDRKRLYGPTVPLGSGDADFRSHFAALKEIRYEGWLVIQGARGADDVETAKTYLHFIHTLLRAL